MTPKTKSTAAPETPTGDNPVAIRLPGELLARLDALVPKIAADTDTAIVLGRISRSSVLRLAVLEGVKVLERRHP